MIEGRLCTDGAVIGFVNQQVAGRLQKNTFDILKPAFFCLSAALLFSYLFAVFPLAYLLKNKFSSFIYFCNRSIQVLFW